MGEFTSGKEHTFDTEAEAEEFAEEYRRCWYGYSGMATIYAPDDPIRPGNGWRVTTWRSETCD